MICIYLLKVTLLNLLTSSVESNLCCFLRLHWASKTTAIMSTHRQDQYAFFTKTCGSAPQLYKKGNGHITQKHKFIVICITHNGQHNWRAEILKVFSSLANLSTESCWTLNTIKHHFKDLKYSCPMYCINKHILSFVFFFLNTCICKHVPIKAEFEYVY